MPTTKVQISAVCLISTFVVHCLDSIMYILAISKVSRLELAFIEQAGLNLIPEDTFLRGVAHLISLQCRGNDATNEERI